MIDIILLLIVGSGLVYISKFNFIPVSLNLGFVTISDIPLFYVIVASLLVGLVLSYLLQLIRSISNSLALRSKDKEIKKNKQEVLELSKRVHQLEIENEKIRHNPAVENEDVNAL